ncbi:MAG TPA: hypothetical protein VHE81_20705 [Lacipirellulaceae bacterium]|nr:hypothetical protein [Lacipirellulaceae bacterium]
MATELNMPVGEIYNVVKSRAVRVTRPRSKRRQLFRFKREWEVRPSHLGRRDVPSLLQIGFKVRPEFVGFFLDGRPYSAIAAQEKAPSSRRSPITNGATEPL